MIPRPVGVRLRAQRLRAAAPGRLPPDGEPVVAQIKLPRGRRARYGRRVWISDLPIPHPLQTAAELAEAFPKTGLWPVLWLPNNDDPAGYMDGAMGLDELGHISPLAWLRQQWRTNARQYLNPGSLAGPFPGLAPRQATSAVTQNPFVTLANSYSQLESDFKAPYQLLLIPTTRPADTVAITGLAMPDAGDPLHASVLLRSWEDRFNAYVVAFSQAFFILAVNDPPRDPAAIRRLAAEQFTLSPTNPASFGDLTRALEGFPNQQSTDYPPGWASPRIWPFNFWHNN
jgi:hypothetical protein